jgi:hypothetical protein
MIKFKKTFLFSTILTLAVGFGLFGLDSSASALSGSDFHADRIIDDGVFFNPNTMNPGDIQAFLNAKVPSCDTNGTQPFAGTTRAAYGTSKGHPPPYVCLKDYSQSVPSMSPDAYCTGNVSGGTKSAAQIIYDVSQACGVSPKVILVTLQKEQALVTDDWPWSTQYSAAMGYACPDTAACDTTYANFFSQVYYGARQFQIYVKRADLFSFVGGQTSFIQYNPNSGCNGTNVAIQNQATAGLYNYTPYQPNAAALSNLSGTGDSCSAYGNRNFWRTYIEWFGSPNSNTPYAWMYEGQSAYSDSAMTQPFTSYPTVAPGGKIYLQVKARNMGTQPWAQSVIRLGTARPLDRSSPFQDTSWVGASRPAQLVESTVAPGQIGTFNLTMKAPNTPGTYTEFFNIVAEGVTWLNDLGLNFTINVNNVEGTPPNSINTSLDSGATLNAGNYLLSPDAQSVLVPQKDGNLVLYSNFGAAWSTGRVGGAGNRLIMQNDGNLVLYDQNMHALWSSQTSGNPGAHLVMQTDGNLVIYNASNAAIWATYTLHNPNHMAYINTTLWPGTLFPGQSIDTADRRYHLVLQKDGNLVLYSPNRALWASGTDGRSVSFLTMQSDGNLVLYDSNFRALWYTRTSVNKLMKLTVQQDGNLVLYNSFNQPYWNTATQGQQ